MTIDPAVADTNWIDDASELYLTLGSECEIDRPVYQGDVFHDVPLPRLVKGMGVGTHPVEFQSSVAMVVPHPCQCYHGDRLRQFLTVAPVKRVEDYNNFGPERTGARDKFALIDLPDPDDDMRANSHVADLGKLISIPSRWLLTSNRIACLSHRGLGLLAKRVLLFQLRCPTTLVEAMKFTAGEWAESYLMQAWIRKHRSLSGYSAWMRKPQILAGVAGENPIAPYDVRELAYDVLLEEIQSM